MSRSPTSVDAAGPWLALLIALAAWLPSLWTAGFSYDDREAVERNPVVEGGTRASEAFRRDYWDHLAPAGHYRPLASLSLRVDRARAGLDDARTWHATNVLLHACVVSLLAFLLLSLGGAGLACWSALALFAAHPALADSVAWISGRSSMLCALGGLLGALCVVALAGRPSTWARGGLAAVAAAGLLAALLGKEDGVVFGALYPLLAARASRKAALCALAGCAVGVGAYLALRAAALGSPWPSAPHAPLADADLAQRLLVAGRAQLELARLALWPVGHPPSYESSSFLREPGLGPGLLGWLAWGLLAAVGVRGVRRDPRAAWGWSLLLCALALVPMQQWIPSGVLLAPRFLYLPLLFAVPALGRLAQSLAPRPRAVVAAGVLAAAVAGAWARATVYADRASFHRAVLAAEPGAARAWNELGLACEESGDSAAAVEAFERATDLDPDYGRPWNNLGRLALVAGDLERAREHLERAVLLGPGNAVAWHNLAALQLRLGQPELAREAGERALALAPRRGDTWRVLGRAHAAAGQAAPARAAFLRALELDPSDSAARALLDGTAAGD